MMNLRDSLLKAGVVNKKDVQRAQQELQQQARQEAGNRERKALAERREREAREAEIRAEEEARAARRREANARQEAEVRLIAPRQLLRARRISFRPGPQRFWFRAPHPPQIWRLDLPERVAHDIRCGALAVAWCDDQQPEVVVVDREGAARVAALRPELILFWNRDGADPDPAERLHPEDGR